MLSRSPEIAIDRSGFKQWPTLRNSRPYIVALDSRPMYINMGWKYSVLKNCFL